VIAALFVARDGEYWDRPDVDAWDIERDARKYAGPHPVVAHPPCQLWVNFAALNYKRYGGEHNKPGNDLGCFESALASVRRWGGVLEHPANTNAWKAHGGDEDTARLRRHANRSGVSFARDETMKKPKVGRPSLSGRGVAARLEIKLAPADRKRYEKVAEDAGLSLSEWVRVAMEQAYDRR
jgi:hypothetical protein